MSTSPSHASPAARLRADMDKSCVPIPGAFNALCARAIARAGFQACYISGAATSVSAGVPDVGVLSLEHFCRVIRESADASGLPVLADADTGFGTSPKRQRGFDSQEPQRPPSFRPHHLRPHRRPRH
jgi:methylisocitrate lyase